MRINERETSSKARWSLRLALFMAQLMLVTALLHRFTDFPTAPTINLVVIALIGAAIAILLAVLAFLRIWNTGIKGTGVALTGLLFGIGIYIAPIYYLPSLMRLPAINDVSTDLLSPPQFDRIAEQREPESNSTTYPGALFISQQARAYPDISTLTLERSAQDSYELVRNVVADLGWQVVNDLPPQGPKGVGVIEAVDRSLLLGFRDDVVIRVAGDHGLARIDMRSASRYGRHDLGANAHRIREVFGLVKNRIARAEARKLDAIERQRITEKLEEERRLREIERRQKAEQLVSEPAILPPAQFDAEAGAGASPAYDPELSQDDTEAPAAGRQPHISGFEFINSLRKSQQTTTRPAAQQNREATDKTQKIRASKRKRQDSWIPFKLDVQ